MMKTHLRILASMLILSACSNTNDVQTVKPLPSVTQFSVQVKPVKVDILTDHTLPEDFNLSSAVRKGVSETLLTLLQMCLPSSYKNKAYVMQF